MGFVEYALIIAVILATPLLLASVGELVAERAGVLNLGVDGMMLVGASVGVVTALQTSSILAAFAAAMASGAVMGAAHAFFAVSVRANQIVAGLTLGILGVGLSSFIGAGVSGTPVTAKLDPIPIPLLESIPVIGNVFFNHDIVVYIAILLLPATSLFLQRTRVGSAVRACGSAPSAADTAGISVIRIRYAATIFGGALAGVGGAYFSCIYALVWADNLTAGRGWIALALVIFASWKPLLLLPGAILFGFVDAMNFQLQTQGVRISSDWLGMLPYVFTLVALIVRQVRRRSGHSPIPDALGEPYRRESRT